MIFDYWMFELLFICLITSKLFKIEIYSHQKIGIFICSIISLILGSIRFIILCIYFKDKENYSYFNIKYKWFIPISIFIYLFIINSTSYIYTKLKIYMDLKFISAIKLLILYGIIGFIFSFFACIIETSFKCIGGSEKNFFCKIYELLEDYNETTENEQKDIFTNNENDNDDFENKDKYIENFIFFIDEFRGLD